MYVDRLQHRRREVRCSYLAYTIATEALVTYVFRCSAKAKAAYSKGAPVPIDDYEWAIFGGETESKGVFEFDQLQKIALDLLGALRDAQNDLQPGARGNMGRVLRHFQTTDVQIGKITRAIRLLNARLGQTGQVARSTEVDK